MRRRTQIMLAASAVLCLGVTPETRAAPDICAVPVELTDVAVKLPHVAERLHAHQKLTIVAIGGGSTRGAAAGSPDLAYPHRLQLALAAFYPELPVLVVNAGVPRQSAQQMVDRFATDVFAENPNLVVWEVGISEAVRGIEIDEFATALGAGIDEVKKRAIDILLVDMQFSRKTSTLINFDQYLKAVHRVGDVNDVYVFPRFEMMRYWSEQNVFNFDAAGEAERAQLAAKVYDCIGHNLAEAIRKAAR
jgi:acyl-CoA thioesterase I